MLGQLKRKQFNKKFKDEENPRNNFIDLSRIPRPQ